MIDALDRLERLEDQTHVSASTFEKLNVIVQLQCMLRDIWDQRDDRHLHEFTFDWLLARDNAGDAMIKVRIGYVQRSF